MIKNFDVKSISRIVDGDTVWALVDVGFRVSVDIEFRLKGLNTPEVVGSEKVAGVAAKAELSRLFGLGPIRVVSEKTEKYGRWLGTFFVMLPDGTEIDVNQSLIDGGFAKPYDGKGPKS